MRLDRSEFEKTLQQYDNQQQRGADEDQGEDRDRRVTATIRFENDRYERLHQKVKEEPRTQSDQEIIRIAHQEYFEQMADEHGWTLSNPDADQG